MINISPGVRAFDSVAFAGTIECEFCFSEHPSKYTHLLPGKHSWIIILHFPPLKRFGCVPTQGAGLIMLFACLWTTFLPGSLYSRLLFFSFFPVSGVWSRPDDDAATSSPRAETAVSYSATEFSATAGEFIKALLQNKNIHSLFCLWDLALLCYTTCIWIS